jgi:hypothetical protein
VDVTAMERVGESPDFSARARRVRIGLPVVAVGVLVVAAILHALLVPQPKELDVSTLPVDMAHLGQFARTANPLEPTLARAAVLAVSAEGTTVRATVRACPAGTWSPNGVTGFLLHLRRHEDLLPLQSSPLLEVTAQRCTTSTLDFEVPRGSTVTGVGYEQVPYVVVQWAVSPPLRVAGKVRAP